MTNRRHHSALRYTEEFYASRSTGASRSAEVVLGVLWRHFQAASVIDFGCAHGEWLRVARSLGTRDILGIDGPWVNEELVADIPFVVRDLSKAVDLGNRYELALCLEVAEHLPPSIGPLLVKSLVRHADAVLFSAAIPGQRGTHHINCRRQSYWAGLFLEEGLDAYDFLRPAIWEDEEVAWFYRQNSLVYAKRGSRAAIGLSASGNLGMRLMDVVHPFAYERLAESFAALVEASGRPSWSSVATTCMLLGRRGARGFARRIGMLDTLRTVRKRAEEAISLLGRRSATRGK